MATFMPLAAHALRGGQADPPGGARDGHHLARAARLASFAMPEFDSSGRRSAVRLSEAPPRPGPRPRSGRACGAASRAAPRRMNSRSVTPLERALAGAARTPASADAVPSPSAGSNAGRSGCRPGAPRAPAWRSRRARLHHLLGHPAAAPGARHPHHLRALLRPVLAGILEHAWKPSTKPGQRRTSRHSAVACSGAERHRGRWPRPARHQRRRPRSRSRSIECGHRLQEGPHVLEQPLVLGAGPCGSASRSGACGARGAPTGPRSGPRSSSRRSSGYIVLGFTDSTPSVISPIRSISWLPYEGCRRSGGAPAAAAPGGGAARR